MSEKIQEGGLSCLVGGHRGVGQSACSALRFFFSPFSFLSGSEGRNWMDHGCGSSWT